MMRTVLERLPVIHRLGGSPLGVGTRINQGVGLTIVNDPFDEDRVLREHLATLGGDALRESWRACSTEPQPYRDAMLREMVTRPDLADLA